MKYLRGVKDVMRSSNLQNLEQYGDLTILFDWVYYQDVLARFSLRHWYKQTNTSATAILQETCVSLNLENDRLDWPDQVRVHIFQTITIDTYL